MFRRYYFYEIECRINNLKGYSSRINHGITSGLFLTPAKAFTRLREQFRTLDGKFEYDNLYFRRFERIK